MSVPIIPDPTPLLRFIDAPTVALICVGVVLGAVVCVAFAGLAALVRGTSAPTARHRAVHQGAPAWLPPRAPHQRAFVQTSGAHAHTEVMPAVRTGVAA